MALELTQADLEPILLGCTGFVDVASKVSTLLEETLGYYVPVIGPNQAGCQFSRVYSTHAYPPQSRNQQQSD